MSYVSAVRKVLFSDRERTTDTLVCITVFFFALAFRAYRLGEVPPEFMCDEADNYQDVFRILYGQGIPFFGHDWKPQPAMSAHLLSWWTWIVGFGMAKARLFTAIVSSVMVAFFYVVAKRLTNRYTAAAAATLLALNPWALNFSRSAWENIHVCLYTLGALHAVFKILETDRWRWYAIAGVWSALGFLGYFSGRLVLPIVVFSLLMSLCWDFRQWQTRLAGIALTCTVFLVLCSLQISDMVKNHSTYSCRTGAVAIWNQEYPQPEAFNLWDKMQNQLSSSLTAFWKPNNRKGRYAPIRKPLLHPFTGSLMAMGLFLSLFRFREWSIVWISFLIPWFATQGLANGAPDVARAIGLLVPAFLFVALGLELFKPYYYGFTQRKVPIVLVLFCAIVCSVNLRRYYDWQLFHLTIKERQPAISASTFEPWMAKMKHDYQRGRGRSVNAGDWQESHERFTRELVAKGIWVPFDEAGMKGLSPQGPEEVHEVVPGNRLEKTLRQWKYTNSNWVGEPAEAGLGLPNIGDRYPGPASVIWYGDLRVDSSGRHEFVLASDDGSYLLLDGHLLIDNGGHHSLRTVRNSIHLEPGWHSILIGYHQDDGGSALRLTWLEPGTGEESEIASDRFRGRESDALPKEVSRLQSLLVKRRTEERK